MSRYAWKPITYNCASIPGALSETWKQRAANGPYLGDKDSGISVQS